MIATKPTEAVREKHTVPRGRMRAAELAIPAAFVRNSVRSTQRPSSARISVSDSQDTSPPHQSGRERLGVCPLSSRARSPSLRQRQPEGGSPKTGGIAIGAIFWKASR